MADYTLADVEQALRGGTGQRGQIDALARQRNHAEALRDTAMPTNDQYNNVSPLEVMASSMGQSLGKRKLRGLNPQLQAAQTAQDESGIVPTIYGLQRAKAKQDQAAADKQADRESRENVARLNKRAGNLGKSRYIERSSADAQGNPIVHRTDKWTGEAGPTTYFDGTQTSPPEAMKRKDLREKTAADKKEALKTAEEKVSRIAELKSSLSANADSISAIRDGIGALGEGANSGPIQGRLPSFKSSTIRLENARDRMALTEIAKYTFGSLSEAEGNWLKTSQVPNLDEDDLRPYLMHREQVQQRHAEAQQYELEALMADEEVDPDIIREILNEGGFDPSEYGYKPGKKGE